jgi:Electron transfer flavoprotein, alpha subunit
VPSLHACRSTLEDPPEVITIDAAIDDKSIIKTKLLQKIKEEETGVRIEEASIIVSGGRGIGSAEGFQQLQELALLLNGAVGASRPACDYGWAPPHRQVVPSSNS